MIVNIKRAFVKLTIFLYMLYLLWYTEAIGYSNVMLYGGICLVAFSVLIYINGRSVQDLKLPRGLSLWLVYGIVSLITGLIVAVDKEMLISSIFTFFAFLFLCVCITVISTVERDIQWFIKYLLIICILCAVYTIFRGHDYYNGVIVITMGPNNNPNTLGALMVFGMFALMYKKKKGITQLCASFFVLTLFLYIIVITGSKKALIGGGIFLLVWLVGFIKGLRGEKLYYRFAAVMLIMVGCIIGGYYFTTTYVNTASFTRMATLFTSGSTQIRSGMYKESVDFFLNNPIVGIGYDQFRVLSQYQTYAHSTYAEVMSNSGIIGMFVFFIPIIFTGIRLWKLRKDEPTYRVWIFIALYCVEIFLGSVNIFMYDITHLLIWTLLFVYTDFSSICSRGEDA